MSDSPSCPVLTPAQLRMLQHSLGVDQYGRGSHYRNRYVCDPGNPEIDFLVSAGLMEDRGSQPIADGMHCYVVTDAGKKVMFAQSPQPPKLSASKLRYRKWLAICDCFPDWKFGDYIKNEKRLEQLGRDLR